MKPNPMPPGARHAKAVSSIPNEDPGRQVDGQRNIGGGDGDLDVILGSEVRGGLLIVQEDPAVGEGGGGGAAAVNEVAVLRGVGGGSGGGGEGE